jgi:hypothetical protein
MNIVPENLFKLYTACNFDQRIILNLLHISYIVVYDSITKNEYTTTKKVHPWTKNHFLCYTSLLLDSIQFSDIGFLNEQPAANQ